MEQDKKISVWKSVFRLSWRSQIEGSEHSTLPQLDCQNAKRMLDENGILDPVHQHANGLWWFDDETWSDEFGGYATREECVEACKRYAEGL